MRHACSLLFAWGVAAGCAATPEFLLQNPVEVPIQDYDTLWNQTVDVVDDYFEIAEENRLDGRIETAPKTGATLLEPWHHDAANAAERLEGTLQSIRRRAVVRISPTHSAYALDVQVLKELEDLPRPQFASAGDATFRHDTGLEGRPNVIADEVPPQGWIALGRDFALEQEILRELHKKLMSP